MLLHATRGRHTKPTHGVSKLKAGSVIFSLVSAAFAVVVGVWITRGNTWPAKLESRLAFVPFVAVIAMQVFWILRTPLNNIVAFYHTLAKERAEDPDKALGRLRKEYIQSYRDMREHGNALLILVMEGVLTAALLQAANLGILFAMLVLWVMPAAFAWFIATALEAKLADVK